MSAVQAPAPSKARDLEDELERAAHTPLPEDADTANGDQQTDDPADIAAEVMRLLLLSSALLTCLRQGIKIRNVSWDASSDY